LVYYFFRFGININDEFRENKFADALTLLLNYEKNKIEFIKNMIQNNEVLNNKEILWLFVFLQRLQRFQFEDEFLIFEPAYENALNLLERHINGLVNEEFVKQSIQDNKLFSQDKIKFFLDLLKRFKIQIENKFCLELTIQNDKILTNREKSYLLNNIKEKKIFNKNNSKQQCKFCENIIYNIESYEYCIRKYLKNHFNDWTSGVRFIDRIIQICQEATFKPNLVIEWIPFKYFDNINYKTSGGYASIFTACMIYNLYCK
ncbi:32768_t:CDS:2, partial [Gigaspora margarita]